MKQHVWVFCADRTQSQNCFREARGGTEFDQRPESLIYEEDTDFGWHKIGETELQPSIWDPFGWWILPPPPHSTPDTNQWIPKREWQLTFLRLSTWVLLLLDKPASKYNILFVRVKT